MISNLFHGPGPESHTSDLRAANRPNPQCAMNVAGADCGDRLSCLRRTASSASIEGHLLRMHRGLRGRPSDGKCKGTGDWPRSERPIRTMPAIPVLACRGNMRGASEFEERLSRRQSGAASPCGWRKKPRRSCGCRLNTLTVGSQWHA